MNILNKQILNYFKIPVETLKALKKEKRKSKSKLPLFEYVYCYVNKIDLLKAEKFYIANSYLDKTTLLYEESISRDNYLRYENIFKPLFNITLDEYRDFLTYESIIGIEGYLKYKNEYTHLCSLQEFARYYKSYPEYSFDVYRGFISQTEITDIKEYYEKLESEKLGVSPLEYQKYIKAKNPYKLPITKLDDILLIDKYGLTIEDLDAFKTSKLKDEEFFLSYFMKLSNVSKKEFLEVSSAHKLTYGQTKELFVRINCKNPELRKLHIDLYFKKKKIFEYIESNVLSIRFPRVKDFHLNENNFRIEVFNNTEDKFKIVFPYVPSLYELIFAEHLGYLKIDIVPSGVKNISEEIKETYDKRNHVTLKSEISLYDLSIYSLLAKIECIQNLFIETPVSGQDFVNICSLCVENLSFNSKLTSPNIKYETFQIHNHTRMIKLPVGFRVIYKNFVPLNSLLQEVVLPSTIEYIDLETKFPTGSKIKYSKLSEVIVSRYNKKRSKQTYEEVGLKLQITKDNILHLNEIKDKHKYVEATFAFVPKSLPKEFLKGFINLQRITLPNGIETIGLSAFRLCRSLKEIEIPSSVKSIDNYAFKNSGVEKVILSSSLEVISNGLFENCYYLQEISRYSNVQRVEENAFRNCSSLKKVVFPLCTNWISSCFYGCSGLIELIIPGNLTYFSWKHFEDQEKIKVFVLPKQIDKINVNYSGAFPTITTLRGTNWKKNVYYRQEYKYVSPDEYTELVNEYLFDFNFPLLLESVKKTTSDIIFGETEYQTRGVSHSKAVFVVEENKTDEVASSSSYIVADSSDTSSTDFVVKDVSTNFLLSEKEGLVNDVFTLEPATITSFIASIKVKVVRKLPESELYFALIDKNMNLASDCKKVSGNFSFGKNFTLQFNVDKDAENGPLYLTYSKGGEFIVSADGVTLNILFRLMDELDLF